MLSVAFGTHRSPSPLLPPPKKAAFTLTKDSWDLGSCIPKGIIGVDGYLQREQPEIESLFLTTGAPNDQRYYQRPASLMLQAFCDVFEASPG